MAFLKQPSVLHRISSCFLVVLAFLPTVTASGAPYGFDQTTGTRISGREFLLSLSVDHPTTGALLKVHNLAANRQALVKVTTYNMDSTPLVSFHSISYSGNKTITVSPPTPSTFNPFVVNVTSSQNITLVAMRNGTASFGSYIVYPTDIAGMFYDIVSFPSADEEQQSEIVVIGVDDKPSDVTFRSSRDFTLHGNNNDSFQKSFQIQQDNETISYTAIGELTKAEAIVFRSDYDLTGATISSSTDGGRVVVISGSYCPNGPCDVLIEQMPPIQTLGKSFFIVPTKNYAGGNCFRVLSPWDNTTVTTDSFQADINRQSFPLSRGEFFDIDLKSGSIENVQSIQASNPIIVMHYLIKSDKPTDVAAMTLIPSVEQFTNGNTSFSTFNVTSSPTLIISNFINIITLCDYKNNVKLNRRVIAQQDWTNCPPLDTGGPTYCATQKQLTKDGVYTLESGSAQFSAVQYGIRTDKSAFANTVFMSFEELTCDISKDGVVIPCKNSKPKTTQTMTTLPTTGPGELTTMVSTFFSETEETPTGNGTDAQKSTSHHQKAGTVLAICIGIITLIAGIVALAVIANAACGKRSKWKRLHNQGTDNSITLDSVSV